MSDDFPEDCYTWPPGGLLFARLVRRYIPSLTFEQIRPLADALFTDFDMTEGATMAPGQAEELCSTQGAVLALAVQAWTTQVRHLLACGGDAFPGLRHLTTAVRVIQSAIRWLPGWEGWKALPMGTDGEEGGAA